MNRNPQFQTPTLISDQQKKIKASKDLSRESPYNPPIKTSSNQKKKKEKKKKKKKKRRKSQNLDPTFPT
jgi:hypothetical protein